MLRLMSDYEVTLVNDNSRWEPSLPSHKANTTQCKPLPLRRPTEPIPRTYPDEHQ